MHIEIERKFLVTSEAWRAGATGRRTLRDGLVSQGENGKVRVRLEETRAWLTVKGARSGISRAEFENEIPVEDGERLLDGVCTGRIVEKDRFLVPHGDHLWEVDVFKGALAGLVWAEIELEREDQAFAAPAWLGREVTGDPRFRHANLLGLCADRTDGGPMAEILREMPALGRLAG